MENKWSTKNRTGGKARKYMGKIRVGWEKYKKISDRRFR